MKTFFTILGLAVISAAIFVGIKTTQAPIVSSVTGPDSFYPCETHNGVGMCFTRKPLNTASTTICAIQSPNATSTLTEYSGFIETISSTTVASSITVAKASTPYATTTQIGTTIAVAAGAQVTGIASTTIPQQGAGANIFAPNQWLVIGQQGGVGTFSPKGVCEASFGYLQ